LVVSKLREFYRFYGRKFSPIESAIVEAVYMLLSAEKCVEQFEWKNVFYSPEELIEEGRERFSKQTQKEYEQRGF
jgi:hypothetical protein